MLVTDVLHVDYSLMKLKQKIANLVWFGSKKIFGKVRESEASELNLTVGSNIIQPVKSVRDLNVQLYTELSMKTHVSKVASSCFYELRIVRQITRLVSRSSIGLRVQLSRLDYCNSVLAGLLLCTTEPLQRVLNAAARLVLNLRPRDQVSPALQQLHWLPIDYRITYKLCLIAPRAY